MNRAGGLASVQNLDKVQPGPKRVELVSVASVVDGLTPVTAAPPPLHGIGSSSWRRHAPPRKPSHRIHAPGIQSSHSLAVIPGAIEATHGIVDTFNQHRHPCIWLGISPAFV